VGIEVLQEVKIEPPKLKLPPMPFIALSLSRCKCTGKLSWDVELSVTPEFAARNAVWSIDAEYETIPGTVRVGRFPELEKGCP